MSSTDNPGVATKEGHPPACVTDSGSSINTGSFLPLPNLTQADLAGISGLNRRQRRRLLRDCNEAVFGLNWMHGALFRPVYGVGQNSHTRNRTGRLQYDVQQRILEATRFWLDVYSAVSELGSLRRAPRGQSRVFHCWPYHHGSVQVLGCESAEWGARRSFSWKTCYSRRRSISCWSMTREC